MTLEMQHSLERELDGAMKCEGSIRPERIAAAQANILLALMDCQRKTAERVKVLQWKFTLAIFALGAGGGTVASNWDAIVKIFCH